MMTEEEARKKRCPMPMGTMEDRRTQNHCIASDCMAWQFVDRAHTRETELWSRSKNKRVNSGWNDDTYWKPVGEDSDKEPPPARGFCGAFRKPS
jgi:hypothetical protein